jgi:6-phosphogluconolactonase
MKSTSPRTLRLALAAAALGGFAALGGVGATVASAAPARGGVGSVYIATNTTTGNSVQVFSRQTNGTLVAGGSYATGGLGTGAAGLGQGSVTLSADGHTLLAVDAGSNQVSDFAVAPGGNLRLLNTIGSGGTEPISVAIRDSLVEVLNAGTSSTVGNVTAFAATSFGLLPIPGTTRSLSAGALSPEDVTISPNGSEVVVTEKVSNTIDTFAIGTGGSLAPAVTSASDSPLSFASVFSPTGELLVADDGATGNSALSPYSLSTTGTVTPTEQAVTDGQTAACWVAIGRHGDVFVDNAGSGTISSYRVLANGNVAFFGNTNAGIGSKPLDVTTTPGGRWVYIEDGNNHVVSAFAVGTDGQLTPIGQVPVPASAIGVAAS